MLIAVNSGRGYDIDSVYGKDLGLAVAPKMCLDQSQTSNEVNSSQALQLE